MAWLFCTSAMKQHGYCVRLMYDCLMKVMAHWRIEMLHRGLGR